MKAYENQTKGGGSNKIDNGEQEKQWILEAPQTKVK